MDPQRTGLRDINSYADPDMWKKRFREFDLGAIGSGIAAADFDGDGLPDLFVVNKTESCRLYRNRGEWRFEDVTKEAGLLQVGRESRIWKQGVAAADVNNDGAVDLYVCRFGAPNLLYLNDGYGRFSEAAARCGLAVVDASNMAFFADIDLDGWLDAFLQTNVLDKETRPNGQPDFLFRNRGDGLFEDVTRSAGLTGETQGHSAVWHDFNRDGLLDLYCANDFQVPDQLYLGQGDFRFRESITTVFPVMPYSSMGSDLADIDNDGRLDLFVAEMRAREREKDLRALADFRGLLADPPPVKGPVQVARNFLFRDVGGGHFEEIAGIAGLAATDWTWSARFDDFDADGRVDLHITNGMYREVMNIDLKRAMDQAVTAEERQAVVRRSSRLDEENLVFRNLGQWRFEECGAAWGLSERGVSFGAATADFDGDGYLDLAITNYEAPPTLYRNRGSGAHRLVLSLVGKRANRFGIGAEIEIETDTGRQKRVLLAARGYQSTSQPIVHFGTGSDTLVRSLRVKWPGGATQVLHSLPVDTHFVIEEDVSLAEQGTDVKAPWYSQVELPPPFQRASPVSEPAPQAMLPYHLNQEGPRLTWTQGVEGDLRLFVGGTLGCTPRLIALAPGHPVRVEQTEVLSSLVPMGPSIAMPQLGANAWLVFAAGSLHPSYARELFPELLGAEKALEMPAYGGSVGALARGDFNGDSREDLFIGARVEPGRFPETPASALWWGTQAGYEADSGTDVELVTRSGMVTSAAAVDLDKDDRDELVITTDWGGVRAFAFAADRWREVSNDYGFGSAGSGLWRSVAVADLNSDGRPDFLLGNVGSNSLEAPNAGRARVLLRGRLAKEGQERTVEAIEEGGRLWPTRSRRELAMLFPQLMRRYPKNNDYARASLDEIFGLERLGSLARWEATQVESGVLLSTNEARYRFVPYPKQAQLGPVRGQVVTDFNRDGFLDVALAGADYSVAAVSGANAGGVGLLLLGRGDGTFDPVDPEQSGFYVTGDVRSLVGVPWRTEDRIALIAGRSDGTLILFYPNSPVAAAVPRTQ
ncbi:MAG: VCBS repeat-containing protein [Opitutaceae bacterium]|nr:VCBS repeat-containing protein [Opitutaceae bacterium]